MIAAKSLPDKISFIEPIYALSVRNLPEGPDWLYGSAPY